MMTKYKNNNNKLRFSYTESIVEYLLTVASSVYKDKRYKLQEQVTSILHFLNVRSMLCFHFIIWEYLSESNQAQFVSCFDRTGQVCSNK